MLDRKISPPFVRSTSFDLLRPEKQTLPNGITIFHVAGGDQDIIKIELIMNAGRWFETASAAAYFSSNLISKGTSTRNSYEIAQLLDLYGSHLEISPGLDVVSLSLYSLTKNLAPGLEVLLEMLTAASFPEKELEQMKTVYLQNLKINNEKTSFLASKLFKKSLFGENHPYGHEPDESNITGLTRSEIKNHVTGFFGHITLFVSGKIDAVNAALIAKSFAALPAAAPSVSPVRKTPASSFALRQEKEGSVQSSIRMGRTSVLRQHPDYVHVLFISHILGGYFGSRLMKNIREEKGLTYGIHASLHALKHESYLVIGTDVNKENVQLATDEIRKELDALGSVRIDVNELETARNHFIGSLQSEITTPFAHADKIKNIHVFNLDAGYYQNMISRIEKITAEEILEVSREHFSGNSFCEVAVG